MLGLWVLFGWFRFEISLFLLYVWAFVVSHGFQLQDHFSMGSRRI